MVTIKLEKQIIGRTDNDHVISQIKAHNEDSLRTRVPQKHSPSCHIKTMLFCPAGCAPHLLIHSISTIHEAPPVTEGSPTASYSNDTAPIPASMPLFRRFHQHKRPFSFLLLTQIQDTTVQINFHFFNEASPTSISAINVSRIPVS